MADGGASTHGRLGVAAILQLGLGLVVSVGLAVLLARNVDLALVVALLEDAIVWPLILGLIAYAAGFVLRAVRFWAMLESTTGRSLPLRASIAPFIASFGISDILPLRAGDGFRILWFNRRFEVPAATLIGAMIVERVLDLVTILLLACVGLGLVDIPLDGVLMRGAAYALLVSLAGVLVLLLAPALLARGLNALFSPPPASLAGRAVAMLHATATTLRQIGSLRRLLGLGALSIVIWTLESLVFLTVWASLGGRIADMAKPFLSFFLSMVATLVPSLPGHFGSFDYFGVKTLTMTGVDASFAAAVVLLSHLILWAPTAIFGVGWLLQGSARNWLTQRRPQRG